MTCLRFQKKIISALCVCIWANVKGQGLPDCKWLWNAGGAERAAERGEHHETGFLSDGSQSAEEGKS